MLDKDVFNLNFKEIVTYYNEILSPRILEIYYDYLSENLTEEEFLDVINKIIVEFPMRFKLPSPKEMVELISGSRIAAASAEWQIILVAAAQTNPLPMGDYVRDYGRKNIDLFALLTGRGHTALAAIGGLNAIAFHEGTLQWIEKQFTDVYCNCSSQNVKILKQTPVEPIQNLDTTADEDEDDPFIPAEKWSQIRNFFRRISD